MNKPVTILAPHLTLKRIGGGNETEVYCTNDNRFVVKVKAETPGMPQQVWEQARLLRINGHLFATIVGQSHSIPSLYVVTDNGRGQAQVVVFQPFIQDGRSLYQMDFTSLTPAERSYMAAQLRDIVRRAVRFYWRTGRMPDLYGQANDSEEARKRAHSLWMLPGRVWSFIIVRHLLRSHNLMCRQTGDKLILLVDYDPVQRSWLYQRIYYTARLALFGRDLLLIWIMEHTGKLPRPVKKNPQ